MRYILLSLCFFLSIIGSSGQSNNKSLTGDHIATSSYNDARRGAARKLQYTPEGRDFVSINGENRYTRALYVSESPFRLETSDRPIFGVFMKGYLKNISIDLSVNDSVKPLESFSFCESRYTPGMRSYTIKDDLLKDGEVKIAVLSLNNRDGAIWKIVRSSLPKNAFFTFHLSDTKVKKLSRNGDLGVDPRNSFDASDDISSKESLSINMLEEVIYVLFENKKLQQLSAKEGSKIFDAAESYRNQIASSVIIDTPDPYISTLGGALSIAADGIWDGEVWLHGAVGWRMPLAGWRAAYVGDAMGWHDRARTHFDAYANSQVVDIPNTIKAPTQDSLRNLARADKVWGTPMYSNGYICRNPNRNDQMHHYDMNLCYIDELLWHFNWTGDTAYVKKMWPVIKLHLAWEKMNFDPDNDGLYDAYACIWASDALYYNNGGVTHSTAYNYRANKMAAMLAELVGENPEPYKKESDKILSAINTNIWMPDLGHWAEYKDFLGEKRLHEKPGVWTIYHAMDAGLADPFQSYQSTRYIDTQIPHIPVEAEGLENNKYATISTTNWFPYSWSVNNVAFAEVMNVALAYFQAYRYEEGFNLLKSSVLDGMYLGDSPGNFGQLSFYDAARGECYRDFGDPIGVASRLLVQGLYGVLPDALNDKLTLRPGFPRSWDTAAISTSYISYNFSRNGNKDVYNIEPSFQKKLNIDFEIKAYYDAIEYVKVNGEKVDWDVTNNISIEPIISLKNLSGETLKIEIQWKGKSIERLDFTQDSNKLLLKSPYGVKLLKINDPQSVFKTSTIEDNVFLGNISEESVGNKTFFVFLQQGEMEWWQPADINLGSKVTPTNYSSFSDVNKENCENIDLNIHFNAYLNDIFKKEYLTPNSPYTTLRIPTQGIGEWCHPLTTAVIDDSGIRELSKKHGKISTKLGVDFETPALGRNIAFTSKWDNYPDSLIIPLKGKGSHIYLAMAGTTNHMQSHIVNGQVIVKYSDGTEEVMDLVNPNNWCPIEQDYYVDDFAFKIETPRPYRLHLKTGLVSNNMEKDLEISGVYGREIDGGAAVLLDMPIDESKEITELKLKTLSNDVLIGLMAITIQR